MRCAECGDEITGKPYRQGNLLYCSLECANAAAGLDISEEDGYYEEEPVDGLFEEYD